MTDLDRRLRDDASAWRRALGPDEPAELTTASEPRPARRRRVLIPVLAAAATLLAVLGVAIFALNHPAGHSHPATTASPVTSPPTSTAPSAALQARLVLDQLTAKAGDDIHGTLFLTNTTSSPIGTESTCGGFVQVGLANDDVHFNPVWLASACSGSRGPAITIAVGTTQLPVTVKTTYQSCGQGGPVGGSPQCGAQGAPPLPAGVYHTVIAVNVPAEVASTPLQVTLVN